MTQEQAIESTGGSANSTRTPNSVENGNSEIVFSSETRAKPEYATESVLDDETIWINSNDKVRQVPINEAPPALVSETSGDNVSLANSEVVFRYPNVGRQVSYQSGTPSLKHAHSTSDLVRMRNPRARNLNQKNVILPLAPSSRARSPYLSSVHSRSYEGLDLVGQPYLNSNSHEQFVPYVPSEVGSYANGIGHNNVAFVISSGDYGSQHPSFKKPLSPITSTGGSHHKMPTPPETKKKMFTDLLTTSLSTIYALLIVTLGISFYVVDYLQLEDDNIILLAEGFSLTLLGLALLYLLFLNIDIAVYHHRKKQFERLMETIEPEHMEMRETYEGISYDVTLQKALGLKKKLDHRYCFNKDRHSSNFYLKIGAAVFCFGHLIHTFLILTYRGVIMSSENESSGECMSVLTFIIEILYPIYSIILLFFIFKYSNVIINKKRDFHRFGFMHCLASSLCFWLWTIFRETAEYIQNSGYSKETDTNSTIEVIDNIFPTEKAFRKIGLIATPFRFTAICEHDKMNVIYQNYSPYLYPFSVEYSILVVGIIYIVWVNIGLCAPNDLLHEEHHHHGEDTRECRNDRRPSEPESNITIHADCHASNKGLFGGFIVMVFAIVSVILFFITYYNEAPELAESGLIINQVTKIIIMFCMIFAVVFAYVQMMKLDFNEVAHNSLDNFLCLMCLPAFFVHGIFSVLAAIIFGNILAVVGVIFEIIQIVIQTTFIIDGMSRSSNTKNLRKTKPGREFVTFLVICNVAMWIMQTFEVKSHGLDQYRQEFYSKELWSIVGHSCLPLMMFYRFHSSVCIGDIWKYAYMSSGH